MSHIPFHTCGFVSERATQREPVWLSGAACRSPRGHNCLWTSDPESLVYTGPQCVCSARAFRLSTSREADLPAQRSPPEAQARFSRPDVDACRSRDPEAAPRPWPQASLGVRRAADVQRRHRLSRSRDFDAVYRHGRSVSTRFLVLYWFPREEGEEPRLGIAVPKGTGRSTVRSKIKRQLRETWRARLETLPPGCDYVLIVRPGLVDGTQSKGFEWLGERVDEV